MRVRTCFLLGLFSPAVYYFLSYIIGFNPHYIVGGIVCYVLSTAFMIGLIWLEHLAGLQEMEW